jgi:hypothetical protein
MVSVLRIRKPGFVSVFNNKYSILEENNKMG